MGQLVSRLVTGVADWWSPEPSPDRVVGDALQEMRRARDVLTRSSAHKRRRIGDIDLKIVDLGLSMQNRANRLAEVDSQEFRRHLRQRKLLTRSHGVFQAQLSNLDVQIEELENAPALELTLQSLQIGVDARLHASERVGSIMKTVRTSLATLYDEQRVSREHAAISEELRDMDDSALEQELRDMMGDTEFMGQFDGNALEERRLAMLSGAPAPPKTEPQRSPAAVERELGLAQ